MKYIFLSDYANICHDHVHIATKSKLMTITTIIRVYVNEIWHVTQ